MEERNITNKTFKMEKTAILITTLAILFLLFFPGSTTVVKAETLSEPQTWQVADTQAHMYIVPDVNTREIDVLFQNDLCIITETQTDELGQLWGRTSNANGTGWIRRSQCIIVSDNASITYSASLLNAHNVNPDGPASYETTGYYMIAHRGSHTDGLADNTLEAYEQAGKEGFWGIEADLKYYNGNMVLCHDTPDDTSPLFSDYLDICKEYGCVAMIDIKGAWGTKYASRLQAAVDLVAEKGMSDQVIWQSSVIIYLQAINDYAPESHRWYLVASETTWENALENCKTVNADGINIQASLVDDVDALEELRDNGLTTCFYLFYSWAGVNKYTDLNPQFILSNKPL